MPLNNTVSGWRTSSSITPTIRRKHGHSNICSKCDDSGTLTEVDITSRCLKGHIKTICDECDGTGMIDTYIIKCNRKMYSKRENCRDVCIVKLVKQLPRVDATETGINCRDAVMQ